MVTEDEETKRHSLGARPPLPGWGRWWPLHRGLGVGGLPWMCVWTSLQGHGVVFGFVTGCPTLAGLSLVFPHLSLDVEFVLIQRAVL